MDDKQKIKSRMVRCPLCEMPFKANSEEECIKHMETCQGFIKRHGDNNNNDDNIKVDKSDTNDNNNDSSKNKLNGKRCNYCNKIDGLDCYDKTQTYKIGDLVETRSYNNNICGSIASTYPLNEEIKISEFQAICSYLSKKHELKIYPAWIIDDREKDGINYLKKIRNIEFEHSVPTIIKFNANYIDYLDFQRIKEIIHNSWDSFNGKVIIYICTYPFYKLKSTEAIYDPISIVDKITDLKINVPIVLLLGCVSR